MKAHKQLLDLFVFAMNSALDVQGNDPTELVDRVSWLMSRRQEDEAYVKQAQAKIAEIRASIEYENVSRLKSENGSLLYRVSQLEDAVRTAMRTFDAYATIHEAKGTEDARKKAADNRALNERMRVALEGDAAT